MFIDTFDVPQCTKMFDVFVDKNYIFGTCELMIGFIPRLRGSLISWHVFSIRTGSGGVHSMFATWFQGVLRSLHELLPWLKLVLIQSWINWIAVWRSVPSPFPSPNKNRNSRCRSLQVLRYFIWAHWVPQQAARRSHYSISLHLLLKLNPNEIFIFDRCCHILYHLAWLGYPGQSQQLSYLLVKLMKINPMNRSWHHRFADVPAVGGQLTSPKPGV